MKILTQFGNPEGNKIAVVAAMVGASVEFNGDNARAKGLSKQTFNQQAPIFESSFGVFTQATPVLKFLASSHDLYPSSPELRVQVDEWLDVIKEDLEKPATLWADMIFGKIPTDDRLKKAQADVKKFIFIVEQRLKKNPHIVGSGITLVDIVLASSLVWLFRAAFDEKFRKPLGALCGWFNNIIGLPAFKNVWGTVRLAKVALEAPAPKKKEEKKEAPKVEEKKNSQSGEQAKS